MPVTSAEVAIAIAAHSRSLAGTQRTSADEMRAWRAALEAVEAARGAPVVRTALDGSQSLLRRHGELLARCYCAPGQCATPCGSWCRDTVKRSATG